MNGPVAEKPPILKGSTGVMVLSTLVAFIVSWLFVLGSRDGETGSAAITRSEDILSVLPDDGTLGFVAIEAGPFIMGSDPATDHMAYDNERWSRIRRQGEVTLPQYYMARHEVTVEQFRAFVDGTAYTVAGDAWRGRSDHPVTQVAWTDAVNYTRWLQERLRGSDETPAEIRERLAEGWQLSLPSEAEWEKAARGTDGRIFPWGSQPVRGYANFNSTDTVPAGSLNCIRCAHGLQDMAGNVWELTRSPMQPYPWDPGDDFNDLESEALWVMRGGSFSDPVNNIRTAVRGAVDPGARRDNIGFRLALVPPESLP
ncbi:MAG: SUMF1/EgtB/PvdO family nonheme iron enzyme [Pseudohongiellaceae bacterium]